MTDFQVALSERDKIIQELTDSLKQSIEIRDQLNERNEKLKSEASRLRETNDRRRWITDRQAFTEPQPRLSQTTIDLVDDDYDDDDICRKTVKSDQETEPNDVEQNINPSAKASNPSIDEFKKSLSGEEVTLFKQIEGRFEEKLNEKINDVREKLLQEQFEKAELESETNRLKQLLENIKSGSTEVMDLKTELDKIHEKKMENLRMYFEQKCTDLEKQ